VRLGYNVNLIVIRILLSTEGVPVGREMRQLFQSERAITDRCELEGKTRLKIYL
jgi:hypothetical protein